MAVINFYDDIFDTVTETKEVNEGLMLRNLMEEHIENLPEKKLFEVYDPETDTTEFVDEEVGSYKVAVIVNGEEKNLDYVILEDDVISLLFIPQGDNDAKERWGNILSQGGQFLVAAGSIVMSVFGSTGVGLAIGAIMTGIGVIAEIGGSHLLKAAGATQKNDNVGAGEQKSLPYIDGASNQLQVGNRYLATLGKHLISPNIVGSPYHLTKTKDYAKQEDGGQWIKVLYCAGYGPLKLTNFKLGETILAYNKSTGSGNRKTVMHGQLNTFDHNEDGKFVPGDFTTKWKDNDVKMEILQAGKYVNNWELETVDEDVYGTVYPQAVHEYKIDASPLFAYDKAYSDLAASVVYYNRAIPVGYRTNSVRFSASCPMALEVELTMQHGMFAMRQKDNKVKYKKIPLNLAVQWRYVTDNMASSDAENGDGWNDFDYLVFDNENIVPVEYTSWMRTEEIASNKGLTPNTSLDFNNGWIGRKVFNISDYQYGDYKWEKLSDSEITKALEDGILITSTSKEKKIKRESLSSYPYVKEEEYYVETEYYTVNEEYSEENLYKVENSNEYDPFQGQFVYKSIPMKKVPTGGANPEEDKGSYNYNERRLVVRKTFTPEECAKMCNKGTNEKHYDYVEVRVIRVTPCYLEQTSGENPYSYSDLVNWTYLRSYKFDKESYTEAVEDVADYSNISMRNYLCRPQPVKSDLDDFVYIALSMKQDPNSSVGSTLEQFSCIAESFAPKYDETENKWYPENITEAFKYYRRDVDINGNVTKVPTVKSLYEAGVKVDQVKWIKRRDGNNFVDIIRNELFGNGDNITEVSPLMKAVLDPKTERKYVTSNTASVFALSLVGRHLNDDSKTYDSIKMSSLTDLYQFCEDITDGTKQDYPGLTPNLNTQVDILGKDRYKTASQMRDAGYSVTDFPDGSYATLYSGTYYNNNARKAVVFTAIYNDGRILPASDYNDILEGKKEPPAELVLATFIGGNALQMAEYYAVAIHQIDAFYYESDTSLFPETDPLVEKGMGIIKELSTTPINALRSGVKKDSILRLIEYGAEYDDIDVDYIYYSYYLDVLEQTLLSETEHLCQPCDNYLHVQFNCNAVLSKEEKMENLLQKILITARSYLIRSEDNKYEPLIGKPNPYPSLVINQRNCLAKSNSKSFDELPAGFQVSMIDEDDNYGINDFFVMDKGESYASPTARIEPISIDYITNKNQMASIVRYNLAAKLYQREFYSRTVGIVGNSLSLGDVVLLQDDSLLIGTDNGGRIIELLEDNENIYGFTTDEPVQFRNEIDGKAFGCTIMQPQKNATSRCVTLAFANVGTTRVVNNKTYAMEGGITNFFLFKNPVRKNESVIDEDGDFCIVQPKVDNLVAFGAVGKITTKAVVMSIKKKGNENFDLSLVPYNEDLYTPGFGIPIFESNMTNPTSDNYGFDASVSISDVEEKISNQTSPIMAKVESLYANHIVSLYRQLGDGETPLKETGIYFTVKYDFSTNTIEEIEQLNRLGWFLDYPDEPQNPVYVTTATAFGKDLIDEIEASEWSTPMGVGQNGIDGISAYTIMLYTRSLTEPARPNIEVNYNFNKGMVYPFTIPGWSTNIPPLNADNWPIWCTHATALTTHFGTQIVDGDIIDIITPEEWSKPEQYSDNSMWSRAEIEQYVKNQISDVTQPTVIAEPAVIGIATDNFNNVPVNQTAKVKLSVIQYNSSLDFVLSDYQHFIPKAFDVSWDPLEHELTIKANRGARISEQYWTFTVKFTAIKEIWEYGEPEKYKFVSTEYVLLSTKPNDWEEKYFKYFYAENNIMHLNESPVWEDNKFYDLYLNGIYGDIVKEETETYKTISISVVPVQGGRYLGYVESLEDLEQKMEAWQADTGKGLIIGDYFNWVGDETVSSAAQEGRFRKYKTYSYIGGENYQWDIDDDRSHIVSTLDDILACADAEIDLAEYNGTADNYYKRLLVSNLSVKTLTANEAFIDNLFANHITINNGGDIEGYYDTETGVKELGFGLYSDGRFIANNATIKGKIQATELKIGPNLEDVNSYINGQVTSQIVGSYKGTWSGTEAYIAGDTVFYNADGCSYTCIKTPDLPGTNVPTTVGYWVKLAQKGDPGAPGAPGDSVSVTGSEISYCQSIQGTVVPESGWQSTPPVPIPEQYMWTKLKTSYSLGNPTYTYSVSKNGKDGINGLSVVTLVPLFIESSTFPTAPTSKDQLGKWGYSRPDFVPGGNYYICYMTTFSDNSCTFSDIVVDVEYQSLGSSVKDVKKVYIGYSTGAIPNPPTEWNNLGDWKESKSEITGNVKILSCTLYKTFGSNSVYSTPVSVDTETIIDTENGFIQTNLIDVQTLLSNQIYIKPSVNGNVGFIQTQGFVSGANKGFNISASGDAEFNNITVNDGTFGGYLNQGTRFYIATTVTIRKINGEYQISYSNPAYKDTIIRIYTGVFLFSPYGIDYKVPQGTPHVIIDYLSDKSTGVYPKNFEEWLNNDYYIVGTDPRYTINMQFCPIALDQFMPDLTIKKWYPIFFTDNNYDSFEDPMYASFTIFFT